MRPRVEVSALRKTRPAEHLLRFVFGGSMTAMAGLIAHTFGPTVGGLFLAFPAILPASLTLVARHDGRKQAVAEAGGAILGAVALGVFAGTAWLLGSNTSPLVTIGVAAAAWTVTAVLLWSVFYGRRE
jgi:uncharacterized membrane protein (GlpM family)